MPGKPDIVFTKARVAVFLDGDFWHGYGFSTWQNTVSPFWKAKISKTMERDRKYDHQLHEMGWTVLRLWQHEVEQDFEAIIKHITSAVNGTSTASMSPTHLSNMGTKIVSTCALGRGESQK